MQNTFDRFFAMLQSAGAVTIDDGAMLTDWETEESTGKPENEVVRFSWTDGDADYSDTLTEEGIANGVFDSEGKFVAENTAGDITVVRFFSVKQITAPIEEVSPVRIVIGLGGGIIQGVTSNVPLEYTVYDYDVKGCSPEEIRTVPALDGGNAEVFASGFAAADVDAEKVAEIYEAVMVLNERYAENIIAGSPERFDALEIQGVRADVSRAACEVDNDNPEFYSVYVHLKAGGVECVGDFTALPAAQEYAQELATKFNWPVHDFAARS